MRIHLLISGKASQLPFNYQHMLTGAIHKWLGRNEDHGQLSLYSFSWLIGGKAVKDGLIVNGQMRFFISAHEGSLLKRIVEGIHNDNQVAQNLFVEEVVIQNEPEFKDEALFFVASPVFIKRVHDKREVHYTWKDKESDQFLTETLKHKLRKAGLPDKGVSVAFHRQYHSPRTKVIYYKDIGNKVSLCPVIVHGTPEQLAFAWNVGVGNSTGIGFGALK